MDNVPYPKKLRIVRAEQNRTTRSPGGCIHRAILLRPGGLCRILHATSLAGAASIALLAFLPQPSLPLHSSASVRELRDPEEVRWIPRPCRPRVSPFETRSRWRRGRPQFGAPARLNSRREA
ncbi:hypothetical protein C4D60_Mb04t29960 [Musa balbisiana]|uniref:Uncharacterized protein n=1 Tax=Musa balbisiana TaxID=52838 RepID=A0A4S8KFS9_MUSBA|nr:hypothetical protein C4D60_Mb04t29960 [Musa balbisiana]